MTPEIRAALSGIQLASTRLANFDQRQALIRKQRMEREASIGWSFVSLNMILERKRAEEFANSDAVRKCGESWAQYPAVVDARRKAGLNWRY